MGGGAGKGWHIATHKRSFQTKNSQCVSKLVERKDGKEKERKGACMRNTKEELILESDARRGCLATDYCCTVICSTSSCCTWVFSRAWSTFLIPFLHKIALYRSLLAQEKALRSPGGHQNVKNASGTYPSFQLSICPCCSRLRIPSCRVLRRIV